MNRIQLSDGNIIIADPEFAEQHYPGAWTALPDAPIPEQSVPRHISVGAFFDRFGAAKWGILADMAPTVQAVIKDCSVRQYINLDNADLPAGLAIIDAAGHDIDPAAIIDGEVQAHERP